jgi:hypothetical protein
MLESIFLAVMFAGFLVSLSGVAFIARRFGGILAPSRPRALVGFIMCTLGVLGLSIVLWT